MKKQLTIGELKSLIKEGVQNLQRRALLEGEKKKLMEELGAIESVFSGDNQLAEAAAKSISEGQYDVYDYSDDYLLIQILDLPEIDEVYVNFDMETEVDEYPYYTPAKMYMSNGDPGYPEEGSDGVLIFNLKKIKISKDSEGKEVLFSGMNESLAGAFKTLVEGPLYDQMSETYWNNWRENQIDDRDGDY